jgi:glycine/D-amino acid oxidase-like deaminating enzyme
MKIAIVGAGIIGVTTAWELVSDGHEVTVFERRGAAAEEASFANAGVVAPGYVTPWAAPGMRGKVLRSLLSSHGAIKLRWPLNAPRSAVMDERYKVAISRLGQRVRVAGSAEIGGSLDTMNPAAIQTLYKVLHDWFPGAATLQSGVQQWKGARPMLPDGPPVLGPSGIPGVWLNLGHGSSGWALSCGSARVLGDLIAGQDPGIDLEGLGVERLSL